MQRQSTSLRSKLAVAGVLILALVLAAPTAMARDHHYRHGGHDRSADVLGALVVGAVIGGVLVSASNHHHDRYRGGYYYPARPYASYGYASPQPYPAPVGYYGGYYGSQPGYGYRGRVNIGVVYSSGHGHYRHGRSYRRGGYYRHHGHQRGNWRGHRHHSYRGHRHHSGGSYYRHHRGH